MSVIPIETFLKAVLKGLVVTAVICAVLIAPLLIPAEILTANKSHSHHPQNATTTASHKHGQGPLQRLSSG